MVNANYTPSLDTSLGLIYRLNFLWAKADRDSLTGNLDKWELSVDTIFRNLLYRNPLKTSENGNEEIIDVELSIEDSEIWTKLKNKIGETKKNKIIALRKRDKSGHQRLKKEHYHAVFLYDVWVRKFMHQELNLYMKEVDENPSTSLFGGAFQQKGRKKI